MIGLREKIKWLRVFKKEMNQNDFAKMLGVSRETIWAWESGRQTPSTKILNKLCECCEVKWDFFDPAKEVVMTISLRKEPSLCKNS